MEYNFEAMQGSGSTRISALEDPEGANAALAGILGPGEAPSAPRPAESFARLPVGYRLEETGEVLTEASVRELTGAHEEEIVRAGTNPFRYFDTIIRCGTVGIGPLAASERLLRELTIADRDALLLAIRIATFGEDYTWEGWRCPRCGELSDLTFLLKDIETRSPIGDGGYSVELRDGRIAHLRQPTGADQAKLYEHEDYNVAQQNTVMLDRCLTGIEDPATGSVQGAGDGLARGLGIADRGRIMRAMGVNSYGPRFDAFEITHEACGEKVKVPLALDALFR